MCFIVNRFKLFFHGIQTRWETMPSEKKNMSLLQVALDMFYTKVLQSKKLSVESSKNPSPSYHGEDILYSYNPISKPVHRY